MIETIDLKQNKQSTCRVMICQLNASEYSWTISKGLYYLNPDDSLEYKINEFLKVAKNKSVDLIIFPELSIPEKFINKLQEWSQQQNAIVICGSHYFLNNENECISRSPIIIQGNVYFTEKVSPAPIEISPISGEGLIPGNKILRFNNTFIGNFAILICSDYLNDNLKDELQLDSLDMLCLPCFQRDSTVYHNRINIDCETSENGIYILFSNFIDKKNGDGKSSVFGLMDNIFTNKLKEAGYTDLNPSKKLFGFHDNTEYVVADLDLTNKRPFANRNLSTSPNFKLIATNTSTTDKDILFIQKVSHEDERYKRIDDLFVAPIEFDQIVKLLDENRIVFIIGDPGIGKTYTAVKILKDYFKKGYEPIWFSGLEKEEREFQSKILTDFTPSDKQVVYFEDPFGRTVFERRDALFQIFTPLIDKLSSLDSKIIITSRQEVFENFTKESLLEKDLLELKTELNLRNPSYSNKSLVEIFEKLVAVVTDWYDNEGYKKLVYDAIATDKLKTPLAIQDLLLSSKNIKSKEALQHHIERRSNETIKVFALEIRDAPVPTKALLYIIYFAGYSGKPFLSEIFSKLTTQLNISSSFNVEIRSQVGFRVEQIGYIKTAYRFSHPVYEEALSNLIEINAECEDISKKVVELLFNNEPKSAYLIINRYVVKYPKVALILFKHLLESDYRINDLYTTLTLSQKLISTYYQTKNEDFFKLASQFYPIEKLINDINYDSSNWNNLIQRLNLLIRYMRNSPLEFDSSSHKKIDWDLVFSNKDDNSLTPMKVILLLNFSVAVEKKTVAKFVQKKGENFFKGVYIQLDIANRKKLCSLLNNHPLESILKSFDNNLNNFTQKVSKRKLVREILFSKYMYSGEIHIDDGAEIAINKGWSNLLPAGINKIGGKFEAGSIVGVFNSNNIIIGVGIVEYSSNDLKLIMGHSSNRFMEVLGFYHTSCAIKADFLIQLRYDNQKARWRKMRINH